MTEGFGYFRDTIYALSSGAPPSGVAVIRVSGPGVREALTAIIGSVPPARRAVLRPFRDAAGETIDTGIAIYFPGPASFTGEDCCEFHTHGSHAVVRALSGRLSGLADFRPASAGDFTRRAFINGKIDLVQAEGLSDLLRAETDAQRRLAVGNSEGKQSGLYEDWRGRVLAIRAHLEASLDFADEGDVPEESGAPVFDSVAKLSTDIRNYLDSTHQGEILAHGFRVVLAGPPNAGKSSLLNAVARREAAIVSDEPGTTRDVIDVRLDLAGYLVLVSDTAGLREESGTVERIGIERARVRIREADLVIMLNDGTPAFSQALAAADQDNVLVVQSKADKRTITGDGLAVSAVTGEGLERLMQAIVARIEVATDGSGAVLPTRERHVAILREAILELDQAGFRWSDATLAAEHLRRVSDLIGRLGGRIDVEDVLGEIFSTFCVGK